MPDARLHHNPGSQRYELLVDGEVVGFAAYAERDNAICLTHTEIDPGHEGKGYGSQLAAQTLDRLRDEGRRIIPGCSFMAGYIARHPEYEGMVEGDDRQRG